MSDGLGIFNLDEHHNERREELKISGTTSRGGHLLAGIKGLGYGLKGGLLSIPKQFYEGAREEGIGVSYSVFVFNTHLEFSNITGPNFKTSQRFDSFMCTGSLGVRLKCSLWLCMFLWLLGIQTGYCYKQTRLYSFD